MIDIRGLQTFSLIDYPGKISCIVFTGGCNFRCPFCHNPCLVFDPSSQPRVTDPQFFHFLESRKRRLDGVVISGGEPTLHEDLPDFAAKVRGEGFLVKLDTNGSHPEVLERMLKDSLLNAFGIDYKAPAAKYAELTNVDDPELPARVRRSLELAVASGLELDVRTTVHRRLLSAEDLAEMYRELKSFGVKRWVLQQYNPVEVIDDELSAQPTYSDLELIRMAEALGTDVHVRGLTGRILNLNV